TRTQTNQTRPPDGRGVGSMNRVSSRVFALAAVLLAAFTASAHRAASQDLIDARNLVFGIENVDQKSGQVDKDKVIFSWLTNATYAASVKGHVILLDTYVQRAEVVPGRTPFVVEDLLSLRPEAAFLGHGHGDHADNAAWLGSKLGIPIFASAETCADLNTLDMPSLISTGVLPAGAKLDCREITSFGS